jgi:hypothetical protein
MPDGRIYAAPAYEPEHYADRIYPELRRASRLFNAGMRRLQNALDKCPGGETYLLLEIAEDAIKDTAMPSIGDALERVTSGDVA